MLTTPGIAPPTLTQTRRSARPIVALARRRHDGEPVRHAARVELLDRVGRQLGVGERHGREASTLRTTRDRARNSRRFTGIYRIGVALAHPRTSWSRDSGTLPGRSSSR